MDISKCKSLAEKQIKSSYFKDIKAPCTICLTPALHARGGRGISIKRGGGFPKIACNNKIPCPSLPNHTNMNIMNCFTATDYATALMQTSL